METNNTENTAPARTEGSLQRMVSLLAETLEREAADCEISATKNASPYGEAFHTTGIILRSLAKKLRTESEKQANTPSSATVD